MDDALYRLHAEREESYWWWVGKNRIILDLIARLAPSPKAGSRLRAIDIGCGAGAVLDRLRCPPLAFDAVGVDMSPLAREYCARRGLSALNGALPDHLPFNDPESFDVIVLSEVIEHVPEDRASAAAVARLLRPGGILVCTVPAHMWLWSSHDDFNHHQRRYTRRQFASIFDGLDLEPICVSYYQAASMPLVVGARAVEKLRTRLTGKAPAEPQVRPLPTPINWLLTRAFSIERHLLPRPGVPWGTSVISVHRRPLRA